MNSKIDLNKLLSQRDAAREKGEVWSPSAEDVIAAYNAGWRDFAGADLSLANLGFANLSGANLSGAYLGFANLSGANLREANFAGANFAGADLSLADFAGANLANTCLDPAAPIPDTRADLTAAFEVSGDDLITYRTEKSVYVTGFTYTPGETYTAPIFSVDSLTSCHPGLYFDTLMATRELAADKGVRVVKVRVPLATALATAGGKYRCKTFTVVEYVD